VKNLLMLLFAIVLVGCDSAVPVERNIPLKEGPLSDEESAQIIRAEVIGKEIYMKDVIAAWATDILLSQSLDVSPQTVRGWIVYVLAATTNL